jgi:hypothetical protein
MADVIPFEVFLTETARARPEQYAEALAAGSRHSRVTPEVSRAEFERMKAYLLSYYQGVQPVGSFVNPSGQTIDCVPFEQQPSVRAAIAAGHQVAGTVPSPSLPGGKAASGRGGIARPPLCPEGAVPLVRLTLDQLVRFGTLENFFHKLPPGPGGEPADGGSLLGFKGLGRRPL